VDRFNFKSLNDAKAKEFVSAFISNGFNGGAAYREINPDSKHPRKEAKRRFSSPTVTKELNRRLGPIMRKFDVSEERIIQEAACIAFLDPIDLFDNDGNVRPIADMPEEVRRTIAGLDVSKLFEKKDGKLEYVGLLKKIKISSKPQALEFLARLKKYMSDVDTTVNINLAEMLAAAKERVAKAQPVGDFFA